MKQPFIFLLLTLASFVTYADETTYQVQGDEAVKIMDQLKSSGFTMTTIEDLSGKIQKIETGEFYCQRPAIASPEELLDQTECFKGPDNSQGKLLQSFELAQFVEYYGAKNYGLGKAHYLINNLSCVASSLSGITSCVFLVPLE